MTSSTEQICLFVAFFGTTRQAHEKDNKESAFIGMRKTIEESELYSAPFVPEEISEKSHLCRKLLRLRKAKTIPRRKSPYERVFKKGHFSHSPFSSGNGTVIVFKTTWTKFQQVGAAGARMTREWPLFLFLSSPPAIHFFHGFSLENLLIQLPFVDSTRTWGHHNVKAVNARRF